MRLRRDLKGNTFGRLTVLSRAENGNHNMVRYNCRCECGRETVCASTHLITQHTRSCGCLQAEVMREIKTKHGHAAKKSPEFSSWVHLVGRCTNPNNRAYERYGGRGITVFHGWLGEHGFQAFLDYVGPRPSEEYSIDRIENDGDYEPGNVKWSTPSQQVNNRRGWGKSRFQGVSRSRTGWQARIMAPGSTQSRYIAGSRDEEIAAMHYDVAALRMRGSDARINFPELREKLLQYVACEAALASI